ncbi:MAG: response regulator transcription factor [Bacteroidia bacterium]|nr:response regulator transcription factor [Bacteroidia bacterium]
MDPMRIFLADAAFLVRAGIKSVLASLPDCQVIGEAAHSRDLQRMLHLDAPDVVIMDYNAPGAFQPDDVRTVMERWPSTGMLVISSDLKKEQVFKVLEYGAKGFLLKECDHTEIIGAVQAVSRGDKFFCGKVLDIILERSHADQNCDDACEPARLTERENEIVRLMGEGVATQDIADRLSLSVHTVYTHRKNIMRKLGVTTAAEVILYAVNTSLVRA